ncbi:MAG TPA: hypothetical protein VNL38_03945 [Candidatus Nitrosotenuis sp.]|nr:hypothetical protein [Candidatus Nitrosotenuis sp.]
MKLHELPERRVAVTVRLVDTSLQRIVSVLAHDPQQHLGRTLEDSLPEAQRKEILQRIQHLRAELRTFAERFELPAQKTDVRQILNAELSTIWTLLENCFPKRMKGFGVTFDDAQRNALEADLMRLVAQVERLMESSQ